MSARFLVFYCIEANDHMNPCHNSFFFYNHKNYLFSKTYENIFVFNVIGVCFEHFEMKTRKNNFNDCIQFRIISEFSFSLHLYWGNGYWKNTQQILGLCLVYRGLVEKQLLKGCLYSVLDEKQVFIIKKPLRYTSKLQLI